MPLSRRHGSTFFEPNDYTHAPIITVSGGVALVEALSDACPKDAPAGVKKAIKHSPFSPSPTTAPPTPPAGRRPASRMPASPPLPMRPPPRRTPRNS
jgi:hypothetical protein